MASREPLFLYKETRLNLEQPSAATVHLRLKASHGSYRPEANGRSNEKERTYHIKGLASASAVFHRQNHHSPKAFLWRILDGGHTLSLQAVDVCRQANAHDAPLTLHIHFPSPLKPNCVALADPTTQDALSVFAVDESNNLYSLLLNADVFRKPTSVESIPPETTKPFQPTAFGFKHVHRLVAVNTEQLLATLHDGGVLMFDRQTHAHDATTTWKETFYNSSGWKQGLRNLLPFQGGPTVRHGKVNMDLTAATAVTTMSMDIEGASFIFTVCLDHRMRIWNGSGSILYTGDILNAERTPQDTGKWTIDPSQSNLVRIVETGQSHCFCATYSPIGTGAFKFWRVAASSPESINVKDAFPDHQLVPPAPSSSDIWTMADFGLVEAAHRTIQLWVLWKNNLTYRVQRVEFSPETIETAWANNWVDTYADHATTPAQGSTACDPTDTTERWLRLIFAPGRFTRRTLETALTMYEGGVGSTKEASSSKGRKSLVESVCTVLGSTASLDRDSSGGIDYGQFRATSEIHWRRFYRLLLELDKSRGEALSLALDAQSGLMWVVCADCVSIIRDCSTLERVYHNLSSPEPQFLEVSALLTAGTSFIDGFSDSMLQMSMAALRAEMSEESSRTDLERIQYFSDKSGFWRQITDDDCAQVVDALGENFRRVNQKLYAEGLLSLIRETEDSRTRDVRDPLTDFGRKLVVKGTQETAELQWRILFSQVVLLVHMENEFDSDEDALHSRFDIGLVYRLLVSALRRLELVRWLGSNELSLPASKATRTSSSSQTRPGEDTAMVTILEESVSHLLGFSEQRGKSVSAIITDIIADICALESNIELSPAEIQCFLLKQADRPDLALELGAFADQDAWPTYVQGRVALALRDYDTALIYFKKAATGLSTEKKHHVIHSAGLLDETEKKMLDHGLASYYAHIVALFEQQKAYSYVVDFARLSLQFANGHDQSLSSIRLDMLSRLFSAASNISRFDLAHTALLSMTDPALQHSNLKRLVEKMCETQQTAELMSLPFCNLQNSVDKILEQKCQTAVVDTLPGGGPGAVPWHQVLYAWRVHHNDFKGAAAVLLDRTKKLKRAGEGDKLLGDDVLDTPVTRQYLMLINALSCVEPKQAWIVTEEEATGRSGIHAASTASPSEDKAFEDLVDGLGALSSNDSAELKALGSTGGGVRAWRQVRSLADLRRDYQDELDRIAAIQNNQFAFSVGDEAMDES